MGYLIIILGVSLPVLGLLLLTKIPKHNVLVAVTGSILLSSTTLLLGFYSETVDTEVWSGKVLSKYQDKVGCTHSYSCNCVESCSTSNGHRSCSQVCQVCYDHNYDYDWVVKSNIGNFNISRIDRQGVEAPPRWSSVNVNDPVSKTNTYTNYIKGAKANVLNRVDSKITYAIPEYPLSIYDYYYIDRAITIDNAVSNTKEWSTEISKALLDLGGAKQVNLVMVFTKNPQDFSEQLNTAWLGGKKNDVIVVIGTQDGLKVDWVNVLSWTNQEHFKVSLRDSLLEAPLNPTNTVQLIAKHIESNFVRRKMKEFEYLQADIEPPTYVMVISFFIFLIPIGGLLYAYRWTLLNRYSFWGDRKMRTPSHFHRGR